MLSFFDDSICCMFQFENKNAERFWNTHFPSILIRCKIDVWIQDKILFKVVDRAGLKPQYFSKIPSFYKIVFSKHFCSQRFSSALTNFFRWWWWRWLIVFIRWRWQKGKFYGDCHRLRWRVTITLCFLHTKLRKRRIWDTSRLKGLLLQVRQRKFVKFFFANIFFY